MLVYQGVNDAYNSYQLTNEFDRSETGIMNFSNQNIMHMLVFNIRDDEIRVNKIYDEMVADREKLTTKNLDNYIEIFYASRYADILNGQPKLISYFKF